MKTLSILFIILISAAVCAQTTQSNIPIPTEIQKWKDGQWVYYYNHKDNGKQSVEEEGKRYTAEFVITKSTDKPEIEKALIRAILDQELNQKVIDNIQVNAKEAIEVTKDYKPDAVTIAKVADIIVKAPIKTSADNIEVTKDHNVTGGSISQ